MFDRFMRLRFRVGPHASSLLAHNYGLWLIAGRLYNDVYNYYPAQQNETGGP